MFFLGIVGILFCITFVLATDFIPQGDINLRGVYQIKNATNITAQYYCNSTACYTISDFLETAEGATYYGDGVYILVNNSNYIILNETKLNATIAALGGVAYTNLSELIDDLGNRGYTHLSNFTDNLGNRGYISLSNFSNDPGYYNQSLINVSELTHQGDGKLGIFDSFINLLMDNRITQIFIKALGFYDNTEVYNKTETYNKTEIDSNLSGYVPYTGASSNVNLGAQNLTTTSSVITSGWTINQNMNGTGNITLNNGNNIILSTGTGTKIGTATSQKLGFFNAAPIIQVVATTDLGTVLSNLGLRAAGTAYPITTSGAVTLTGTLTKIGNTNITGNITASDTIRSPGFNINKNINGSGNITTIGYVNATIFYGNGSQLSTNSTTWWAGLTGWLSGWFVNNTGTLEFNDTKLNETLDSILLGEHWFFTEESLIYGTADGSLTNTQQFDDYDSISYNLTEEVINGLEYYANTSDNISTDVNRICIRYKATGDNYAVSLWSIESGDWEGYMTLYGDTIFNWLCKEIRDSSDHLVDNKIMMRIIDIGSASTQHKLYIDAMYVSSGYTPRIGNEVDPQSFHTNENLNNTGYNITADYFLGDGSLLTGISNHTSFINNLTNVDCGAGYLVIGVQNNGTVLCAEDQVGEPGAGDIEGVLTPGKYLTGGCTTGTCSLYANESELNDTIDTRDSDTTYTNGSGISLVGTEFNHSDTSSQASDDNSGNTFIQDIILDGFGHITSIVNAGVSFTDYVAIANLVGFVGNWSADKNEYWNTSTDLDTVIDTDEITELKIDFNTVCAAGSHLYVSGNNLACETDDDTTYTAGSNLSLTGTTFSLNATSTQSWLETIFLKIVDAFDGTWASLTGKPTHLSNFTDNLGNRGYTNLLNFTNGPNFLNATTIGNTTIVRSGSYNCTGTNVLMNVTTNSSGIFGQCVAPSITETDPKAYNGTLAYNSSLANYRLLSNNTFSIINVSTHFKIDTVNITCLNSACTWYTNATNSCMYWPSGGKDCGAT